jgi:hypothetical protein
MLKLCKINFTHLQCVNYTVISNNNQDFYFILFIFEFKKTKACCKKELT